MGILVAEEASPALLDEDRLARERALDPARSFLVQAPAGSGKTELLIQRYLALLEHVEEPERIVALTFTRKAAGEMRERVLAALADAQAEVPVTAPHRQRTRELAVRALAQDERRGWSLVEHPARLAMLTFDALAVAIARRAPIAAGLGPTPDYLDDAHALYRKAAEAAIAAAAPADPHWRCLLAHLDNDAARTSELIAGLLHRRDQWLRQIGGESAEVIRAGLETTLVAEARAVLQATRAAFSEHHATQIVRLAQVAACALAGHEDEVRRKFGADLAASVASGALPAATADALPHWKALAQWLLVAAGTHFRAQIGSKQGFPPGGKDANGQARNAAKRAMLALCEQLNQTPGLAATLDAARRLPPTTIGEGAWHVVEALLCVLPEAAARLVVEFAEEGAVDFVQGNLAALQALGAAEAPTDLLLWLDARIDHLLLDEFQDSSFGQLALLERLTAGWQGETGRTIFAVGDPMQSIYRFREAEVQLFVEAQRHGVVAGLPVATLTLRQNFRSQANLVAWVNDTFSPVLGEVSDPARGAVAFSRAVATRPAMPAVEATLDLCATDAEEAQRVVERVGESRKAGSSDIAILVRARGHLTRLLPALRAAGLTFAAIDLDTLSQRQAMLDLKALTYALVQPADRASWLAVLRAPWCGLALPDLFAVVESLGTNRDEPILLALRKDRESAFLSIEGAARLERLRATLLPALAARGATSLAARVRGAWLALGGPECLDDPLDVETAERFFEVLAAHEHSGDLPDREPFEQTLQSLHAAPAGAASAPLRVMTMHKAKGLEFDTVILAGLARRGPPASSPLLRWRAREHGLLIGPARAAGGEIDPIHAYLRDLDREEEDAELGRVLYVACTRARSRLHLVASPGVDGQDALKWKPPVASSSLAKLWPALASMAGSPKETLLQIAAAKQGPPLLRRLPLSHVPQPPRDPLPRITAPPTPSPASPPFEWAAEMAREIGVIAHRYLARVAHDGIDHWTDERIAKLDSRVDAELAASGFEAHERQAAITKVQAAIRRAIDDPKGRWLFDPAHVDARSEWALTGLDGDSVEHIMIDRTFVAGDTRWIVDFKTSTHEGGEVFAFLASERQRYSDQLARYARMLRELGESKPIRLALYYPLIEGGFLDWAFEG